MIRVTATVIVSAKDLNGCVHWSAELEGKTLLARAVETLLSTPNVDDVIVVTDDLELSRASKYADVEVKQLPGWFFTYKLALVTKEQWIIGRGVGALKEQDVFGDVHLNLDWRNPLVTPATMERMYHILMEDRIAARTVGMYALDPNLFMPLPHTGHFFPVWADPGQDRQKVPQLYRTLETGVIHGRRITQPIPETKCVPVGLRQGLMVKSEEDLSLAEFYLQRGETNDCVTPGSMSTR